MRSILVTIEKKVGGLQLFMDPKELTKNIKRDIHLPTELMSKMAGVKFFSNLDTLAEFCQIPLNIDSSKIGTFKMPIRKILLPNTTFHHMFGSRSISPCNEPDVRGSEGVKVYNDIITWGSTEH